MKEELWKPAPGLLGLYEISNLGRLRRSGPGGPNTKIGKILAGSPDKNGYRTCFVSLGNKSAYKCVKLHRLVVGAFIGEIPDGMQVNHKNGIRDDNRVENLEIVTPSQNVEHSFRALGKVMGYNNQSKGEKHHNSRFTESDIRAIRALYEKGHTQVEIAKRFQTKQSKISEIVLRKSWKHVV